MITEQPVRANMKTLRFTGMLYLTLLHLHTPFIVTATRIFCQAPAVSVGDPANLTCHLPQDLNQSRKSVAVVRRDSIPGSREKLVIGCVWGDEKLVCDANEGFTLLSQQIRYEITFGIPSHEPGTFRCNYSPSQNDVIAQPCSLTLKATRIFCQAPPVFVGDPATLTCHYPEDLSQSRKGISVHRRDSTPGSQYEFLIGCAWIKEKLVCGVRDEIKLITQQPMYDVTFQIAPLQPGTFRCHTTPEDEAVTVQSCNFTSKGNDSSRDTIERSQRRNEDADPLAVTIVVAMVTVLFVIIAVVVTLLNDWFCRRRPAGNVLVGEPKSTKGKARCK